MAIQSAPASGKSPLTRGKKAGPYHLMTGQNPVYVFTMQSEEKL